MRNIQSLPLCYSFSFNYKNFNFIKINKNIIIYEIVFDNLIILEIFRRIHQYYL